MSSRTGVHGMDAAAAVAVRVDVGTLLTIDDGVGRGVLDGVNLAIGCWSQYLPPVFVRPKASIPPQTIISSPVQTAVCSSRAAGALVVLVAVQVFAAGLYLPPVLVLSKSEPPHTIISLLAQTAV